MNRVSVRSTSECRMANRLMLLTVVLATAAAQAQPTIRPGQYEVTMEMKMNVPGNSAAQADRKSVQEAEQAVLGVAGFKQNKKLQCLTSEDVKKLLAGDTGEDECRTTNLKTIGNKITFTVTCALDGERSVVNSELTVGADSFSTASTTNVEGLVSTSRVTGKRVGDCPK